MLLRTLGGGDVDAVGAHACTLTTLEASEDLSSQKIKKTRRSGGQVQSLKRKESRAVKEKMKMGEVTALCYSAPHQGDGAAQSIVAHSTATHARVVIAARRREGVIIS